MLILIRLGYTPFTMQRFNPVYAILLCGLLLRVMALLIVLYIGPYVVLEGADSLSFYEDALYIARTAEYHPFEIGWKPYVNFIGFLMYYIDESISLMFLISILGWILSAYTVDRALIALKSPIGFRTISAFIMIIYPSMFFNTILPLREPFQMLGISLIGFSFVKICYEKNHIYWLYSFLGIFISSILHLSMFVSCFAFVIIIILGYNYAYQRLSFGKVLVSLFFTAVIFTFIIGFLDARYSGASTDILGTIETFRETGAALDARAQYKEASNGVTAGGSLLGLVTGLIQYMLEPLPWNISTIGDVVVFFENIIRVVLIVLVMKNMRNLQHLARSIVLTLLFMMFVTEFFWSMGTINWGTAARHHVPSTPLLLMACFAIHRNSSSLRGHDNRVMMASNRSEKQLY